MAIFRVMRFSLSILFACCGATQILAAPQDGCRTLEQGCAGTLRALYWQAPTSLDPHLGLGYKDLEASRLLYEPLASFTKEGELVPILAARIPSSDAGTLSRNRRRVIWDLRQDVVWSDGEPFTAADVVHTYHYLTNPENGAITAALYETIETVESLGPHQIQITFQESTPEWYVPFTGFNGLIIPEHGSVDPETGALSPLGTGPFVVEQFIPGDRVVYRANPLYRVSGQPYFSEVVLKGGGDAASAARAVLQTGEADYAWNLQVEKQILDTLQQGDQGYLISQLSPTVERIEINFANPQEVDGERFKPDTQHPILSDQRVRQALTLAIDRQTIAEELYGQAGVPSSNIWISANIQPDYKPIPFAPARATELLESAGWIDRDQDGVREKNGVDLSLLFQTSTNSLRQKTQLLIQQNLRNIGIDLELKVIEASIFFGSDGEQNLRHFFADLQMFSYGPELPNSANYFKAYICDQMVSQTNNWSAPNVSRYCNPRFDHLYRKLTQEINPDVRLTIIEQMNNHLSREEYVVIPLVARASLYGLAHDLRGVEPLTPWDLSTWRIQEWYR